MCIYTVDVGKGLTGSAGMLPKNQEWMGTQGASGTPPGTRRALDLGTGHKVGWDLLIQVLDLLGKSSKAARS